MSNKQALTAYKPTFDSTPIRPSYRGDMTDSESQNNKAESEFKENVSEVFANHNITPREIQDRFETLRGLNQEEMVALNKKVLKIMDWRLMPSITLMFLMK